MPPNLTCGIKKRTQPQTSAAARCPAHAGTPGEGLLLRKVTYVKSLCFNISSMLNCFLERKYTVELHKPSIQRQNFLIIRYFGIFHKHVLGFKLCDYEKR